LYEHEWCYTTCRAALLARLEATSSSIANTADSANNTAALHAPSQDKLSRNEQLELQQARRDLLAAAAAKTQSHSSSSSSGGHVDSDVSPPRSIVNSSRGSLLGSTVPLVVVCCKCDAVQSSTLEQQQQALYVQQWLRGLCLDRGASLVYTSARDGTNCQLLHVSSHACYS
jgi:Dynein light intermediate chain (DLIC)